MKQLFLKFLRVAALGLAGPAAAITLAVAPGSQLVGAGSTFTVDVIASDLPVDQVISGFHLMLGYDSTLMTAKSILFGDALGGPAPENVLNDFVLDFDPNTLEGTPYYGTYSGIYANAVEFFEVSLAAVTDYFTTLQPLQTTQPFMLARVTFEMSMDAPPGQALLQLMDDTFYSAPPDGGDFDVKGRDGSNILSATLQNGSVKVPAPGPLALILGVGLTWLTRRRGFGKPNPGRSD